MANGDNRIDPVATTGQYSAFFRIILSWGAVQQGMTAFSLYLLFPFSLRTSMPVILIAVVSALWWWRPTKGTNRGRAGSLVLAALALLWGVVGPLVAFRNSYTYRASTNSPLEAAILPLTDDNVVVGHVLFVTDPFRASPSVQWFVDQMGFPSHVLKIVSTETSHAILAPLPSAIRRTIRGTGGSIAAEELIFGLGSKSLKVNHTLNGCTAKNSCFGGISLGVEASTAPLIDTVQAISDVDELPWGAVRYEKASEQRALVYTARLDAALDAYANGELQQAVAGLDAAAMSAPTDIERIRVTVLQGEVCFAVLSGTIGSSQALAYFDHAMRLWIRLNHGKPPQRTDLNDGLSRWLFDTLWTVFYYHQSEYPNWRAAFHYAETPKVTFRQALLSPETIYYSRYESLPQRPAESVVSAEHLRLYESLRQAIGSQRAIVEVLDQYAPGEPDITRWLFASSVNNLQIAGTSGDLSWPWEPVLEEEARRCAQPWKTRYLSLVKVVHDSRRFLLGLAIDSKEQNVAATSNLFAEAGFTEIAGAFKSMPKIANLRLAMQLAPSPDAPWWSTSYRDWFGALAMGSFFNIRDACEQNNAACGTTLETIGKLRERDNQGNLFAPLLALKLLLAALADHSVDQRVAAAFHDSTGMQNLPRPEYGPWPLPKSPAN